MSITYSCYSPMVDLGFLNILLFGPFLDQQTMNTGLNLSTSDVLTLALVFPTSKYQ